MLKESEVDNNCRRFRKEKELIETMISFIDQEEHLNKNILRKKLCTFRIYAVQLVVRDKIERRIRMKFFITEEQLFTLKASFKENQTSMEKWLDWGGLDLIDKMVEENNNHPIDWDDDVSVGEMNELYGYVRNNL